MISSILCGNLSVYLGNEFFQRIPIAWGPSCIKTVKFLFMNAGVIQNEQGSLAMRLEFEADNRIYALIPPLRAPGLNNALIGDQLDVSGNDQATEDLERPAWFWIDFGAHSGKRSELF